MINSWKSESGTNRPIPRSFTLISRSCICFALCVWKGPFLRICIIPNIGSNQLKKNWGVNLVSRKYLLFNLHFFWLFCQVFELVFFPVCGLPVYVLVPSSWVDFLKLFLFFKWEFCVLWILGACPFYSFLSLSFCHFCRTSCTMSFHCSVFNFIGSEFWSFHLWHLDFGSCLKESSHTHISKYASE